MRTFIIGSALVAVVALGGGVASAAGGEGESFCSNSSKPDGFVIEGDVSTYNNAGEVITFLGGRGGPDGGRLVQTFCNPNLANP